MNEIPVGRAVNAALVFDVLAAIERYEPLAVDFVAVGEARPDLRAALDTEVGEIRRYCGNLPELGGPVTAFLVAHSDLVHERWRLDNGAHGRTEEALRRTSEACACLRASANRLLQFGNA